MMSIITNAISFIIYLYIIMPMKKRNYRRKVRKDKKQDSRIKSLEKMVYKTMENKQLNERVTNSAVDAVSAFVATGFIQTGIGAEDGDQSGASAQARIGNTITLMNQKIKYTLEASALDVYNRVRVLIVESLDGNQLLGLGDILQYDDYGVFSNLVFCSPYTTKTDTNRRYKVHSDRVFELNSNAKGATAYHSENIKFREGGSPGKLLEFDGNTSTFPNNHNLQILAISDSSVSPHPRISAAIRSTYKDA